MNQEDAHGLTPLNWAAKQGNVAMADKLVDAGATINADPEDGAPPLLDACFRGHLDVAKLLVARGGDATVSEGILGHTCLHKAVDGRNPDVVTWLLEDVGLDVNVADLRGYTPLALAAAKVRCVPLLMLLLLLLRYCVCGSVLVAGSLCGSDLCGCEGLWGCVVGCCHHEYNTTLPIAAGCFLMQGFVDIITTLRDHGATTDCVTKKGATPLSLAIKRGQLAAVVDLLNAGTSVDGQALFAAISDSVEAKKGIKAAFKRMKEVTSTVQRGETPSIKRHSATVSGASDASGGAGAGGAGAGAGTATDGASIDFVQLLMDYGGHARVVDPVTASTPLHAAVACGDGVATCGLVGAGADLDAVDSNGRTPAFVAAAAGHASMLKILKARGANFALADGDGNTPLHAAGTWAWVWVSVW